MAKLVILKFNGNFQSGFQVSLEVGEEGQAADLGFKRNLPPAPELSQWLIRWQQLYSQLDCHSRIKPQQIIYDRSILPQQQLVIFAKNLESQFKKWLNAPEFAELDKHLRAELSRQEVIRILICSDLPEIEQLPWCCWDLLDSYPNLEIAIANLDFQRIPVKPKIRKHSKVRILAILGDGRGLNLDADRNFLQSLKDGEVVFLVEPTPQQLNAHLWHQAWDIIFFGGHSKTVDRQGILYLNSKDRLTIEQLKHGFKQAIASGLQLAIFNSCDGLGIAAELGQLFLPQSIVMRMPIPDIMAQEFIKHFLQAYAGGNSLYLATKMARQQLQSWEHTYPCASWLPTIYQNPAIIPPNWADLSPKKGLLRVARVAEFPPSPQALTATITISTLAVVLVCLFQSWGWLEASELKLYDRLLSWRIPPTVEERVMVVTIEDPDIQYQQAQGMALNMRGSLADSALEQLLDKLQTGGAIAIASDVIHDFPFSPNLAETVAQSDNFWGICRIKIDNPQLVSIPAPAELPLEQIGFSNWAIDNDGTIRRQILGMSPDDVCPSSVSLSLRLALKYLEPINVEYEPQGVLRIGETKFAKLKATSGGYHLPDAQGYQTLLNYRRTLPPTIPLREVLTMSANSLRSLVQNKIVLIGVMGYNHDLHYTPYSRGQQVKRIPGVILHAQMTSNIISTVLGEQKALWWLGDRWEIFWIGCWSVVGSTMILMMRASHLELLMTILIAPWLIFATSWLLFVTTGGWLIAFAPSLAVILSAAIAVIYVWQFSKS